MRTLKPPARLTDLPRRPQTTTPDVLHQETIPTVRIKRDTDQPPVPIKRPKLPQPTIHRIPTKHRQPTHPTKRQRMNHQGSLTPRKTTLAQRRIHRVPTEYRREHDRSFRQPNPRKDETKLRAPSRYLLLR